MCCGRFLFTLWLMVLLHMQGKEKKKTVHRLNRRSDLNESCSLFFEFFDKFVGKSKNTDSCCTILVHMILQVHSTIHLQTRVKPCFTLWVTRLHVSSLLWFIWTQHSKWLMNMGCTLLTRRTLCVLCACMYVCVCVCAHVDEISHCYFPRIIHAHSIFFPLENHR